MQTTPLQYYVLKCARVLQQIVLCVFAPQSIALICQLSESNHHYLAMAYAALFGSNSNRREIVYAVWIIVYLQKALH